MVCNWLELRGSRVPSWTRCLVSTLQNQGMLPVAGFQVTLFSAPAPVPHFLHILCGMQSLEGTQTIRLCIAGSWSRGDCVGYALLAGPFHGCLCLVSQVWAGLSQHQKAVTIWIVGVTSQSIQIRGHTCLVCSCGSRG